MRLLRKLNRGALLFVLALAGIVAYLVAVSAAHAAAEPDIKLACLAYVPVEVEYRMLPEPYRSAATPTAMPQDEIDARVSAMKENISPYWPENDETVKFLLSSIESALRGQATGSGVIAQLKKDIASFESIRFEGDTATVTMLVNTVYEGPSSSGGDIYKPGIVMPGGGTSGGSGPTAGQTTDTLILRKVGDSWKVIYSNLIVDPSNFYYDYSNGYPVRGI